jgi:uncharacterized RDD family membrane protein YckC
MSQVEAGWYPDPSPESPDATERYWDGFSWSHQVRPSRPEGAAASDGPYPEGSYKAPAIPSTPDGQVLAGWWKRAGAAVLDWVIVLPLLVLVALPSLASHWHSVTTWWQAGYGGNGTLVTDRSVPDPPVLDPSTGPGLTLYASLFVASLAWSVAFLRWKQATPGKLLTGLKVRRRSTPGALPWSTILRRVGFVAALAAAAQVPAIGIGFLVLAILDYLWPIWDANNQALHDKVAGTNVVGTELPPTEHAVTGPPQDTDFRSVEESDWASRTGSEGSRTGR